MTFHDFSSLLAEMGMVRILEPTRGELEAETGLPPVQDWDGSSDLPG